LHRREVLKLLAGGSALPVLSPELLTAFREVHASLAPVPTLKAFTLHQDATATAMADLIIPRTDTPGAKDVRVNEFLDHIVANWFSDEDRARFLNGLDDVDTRTQKRFQCNFIDATGAQQGEILRVLGEEMEAAEAIIANGPRAERGELRKPTNNFYFLFRSMTLQGYFTSEAGFTQQLHKEIIPGRFDGCLPINPANPTEGA
jgi:hypothetical protein